MNYLSQTTQKEKDDLEKLKATQVGGGMILVMSEVTLHSSRSSPTFTHIFVETAAHSRAYRDKLCGSKRIHACVNAQRYTPDKKRAVLITFPL